jgi:hypothetical protein
MDALVNGFLELLGQMLASELTRWLHTSKKKA